VVPGGVSAPLQAEQREEILTAIPEARDRALRTLQWYKAHLADWADEASCLAVSQVFIWAWCTTTARRVL